VKNKDGRLALGAIHFFVQNQGRLFLALEECGVNDYTVKHPQGQLHGTDEDPWIVRLPERQVCDFFVDAEANGLRFRLRAAEGYGFLVAAFEMLAEEPDDKPPPRPDMN